MAAEMVSAVNSAIAAKADAIAIALVDAARVQRSGSTGRWMRGSRFSRTMPT